MFQKCVQAQISPNLRQKQRWRPEHPGYDKDQREKQRLFETKEFTHEAGGAVAGLRRWYRKGEDAVRWGSE